MIESKQNKFVKLVKELKTKKGRQQHKLLLVEGKKSVADCLSLGVKCEFVLTNEATDFHPPDVQNYCVKNSIFEELTSQVTTQGIIGVFQQPQMYDNKPTTNFIVLDGLQDPGNVGTILRTAVATGYKRVILLDCVDVFSEKVVNSSMTSIFHLELQKIKREDFVEKLKQWDLPLFVADLDGQNALQFSHNYAILGLVLGNEGNGVSDLVKTTATKTLTLPMEKNIESLNVAVSAGILMYLLKRN